MKVRRCAHLRVDGGVWVAFGTPSQSVKPLRRQGEGTSGLDHSKRRTTFRSSLEAERIELGNEPPLSVDGERIGLVNRRRVSLKWFSGTILTGLCGAALMGGAVFAALDGETNFATVPERVEAMLRQTVGGIADRIANAARKTDRLPPPGEANAAREIIRVSHTSRGAGNREIVRVRPFIRVAGNLSLSLSELSAGIPPFNPHRMLAQSAGGGAGAAEEAAGAEPDAEVSFLTRDLASVLPKREARRGRAARRDHRARARRRELESKLGSKAADHGFHPVDGLRTRAARRSLCRIPAAHRAGKRHPPAQDHGAGDRRRCLERAQHCAQERRFGQRRPARARCDAGGGQDDLGGIRARQGHQPKGRLQAAGPLAPTSDGVRLRPVRVVVATDTSVEAMVAWSDKGKYVAVNVRSANTVASSTADDDEDDGKGVRLYYSIYETALRNGVPRPVIEEVVRVYSYDVDFQRRVHPGDSFEILYAGEDENAGDYGKYEVFYALLTTGGETRKYFRHQTTDDNTVDYYDESGKSAKKFLIRKPVADGNLTSSFGGRNHPILGYTKMHTGVDWGAPMGTPIFASGNGVVEQAGWEGGYGKYIRIRHANGYQTAYGHMSGFARGMEPGKKVRQGQVIGYVGSTGLSTGAHLHYEILINGRFVDPLKIKLPRGRVLEGTLLASFEHERGKLEAMITRGTSTRYAQGR